VDDCALHRRTPLHRRWYMRLHLCRREKWLLDIQVLLYRLWQLLHNSAIPLNRFHSAAKFDAVVSAEQAAEYLMVHYYFAESYFADLPFERSSISSMPSAWGSAAPVAYLRGAFRRSPPRSRKFFFSVVGGS
jgi:hypothetical protein